jgi:predicted metal-dependent hydrolase
MKQSMQIDDLKIEVRRSSRRRTVDLIVDRFGELVISVPENLLQTEVEAIIRKKREWIYTKLGQKESVLAPGGIKEYVTGEGFYYLGKKYRLKVINPNNDKSKIPPLRLLNGRFWMNQSAALDGRNQFIKWYTKQGYVWINNTVEKLKERVMANPRSISIRNLKYRWGSCNAAGDVYFHWRVILLPPEIIRYLILHELVHLHEHNHSPAFYSQLSRAAPDHREIEAWLKKNGDHYNL